MTRRSKFQDRKMVLVFDKHGLLFGMYSSLNLASQAMKIPAQSISLCCLGHHISCYGNYFRHYLYDIVLVTPHLDFGVFHVKEYDQMCNLVRRYHDPKEMKRRKNSAIKRSNAQKKDSHE